VLEVESKQWLALRGELAVNECMELSLDGVQNEIENKL
jgi:hypothetical protein